LKIISNELNGLLKIGVDLYKDNRGWFCEGYNKKAFIGILGQTGQDTDFVQDNYSFTNVRGTIRGLHYQEPPYGQAKLFRCIKGSVFDVAVDLRADSPTVFKWKSYILNGDEFEWIYIPKGFGHGFQALSDECVVQYKVDEYYNKEFDRSVRWDDPFLRIEWPVLDPVLSDKDRCAPGIGRVYDNFQ